MSNPYRNIWEPDNDSPTSIQEVGSKHPFAIHVTMFEKNGMGERRYIGTAHYEFKEITGVPEKTTETAVKRNHCKKGDCGGLGRAKNCLDKITCRDFISLRKSTRASAVVAVII